MLDQAIHILLIEDDDVEAEAVQRAFKQRHMLNALTIVPDGLEAFKVLRGEEGRRRLPHPYVILLDLNLPRMGGLEFLQAVRRDPQLRTSTIFVFTTSNRNEDKTAAYNELVAGYLVKSKAGPNFENLIGLLDFYHRLAEFPLEML
ncbi:MAG TPA: response regulator [Anaerolineae bacterium]|nr:response regulator [Anaerolineae bacterium]